MAKGGAGEELALKEYKKGREGRSPAELLAASCDDGDTRAGDLWAEYAQVFKGRRQLVWSRGLKALAGIGEVDDSEAAQDTQQDGQEETGRANIGYFAWRSAVAYRGNDRRADLLDRAEVVGVAQAALELKGAGLPDDAVIDDVLSESEVSPVLPNSIREILVKSVWKPEDLDAFVDYLEPNEGSPPTSEQREAATAGS